MPHQTLARSGASTNCPKTLGRAPWSREHRCARPAQQRAAESKSSEQHRQAAPNGPRCVVHTLIDVAMVPDTAASIRRPAFASGVKHDDAIGCF